MAKEINENEILLKDLVDCATNDDLEGFIELLDISKFNVRYRDDALINCLSEENNFSCLKHLILNYKVNVGLNKAVTLRKAVDHADLETVNFLLSKGLDINSSYYAYDFVNVSKNYQKERVSFSPIIIAILNNNVKMMNFLIDNGASISIEMASICSSANALLQLTSKFSADEIVKKTNPEIISDEEVRLFKNKALLMNAIQSAS